MKLIFLAVFFSLLLIMGYIFRYYFWPFIFALILYVALKPVHNYLLRFLKKRIFSSSVVILLLILVLLIPLFLLLFTLANQSYEFYQFLNGRFDAASLSSYIHSSPHVQVVYKYMNITEGDLVKKATELLEKGSLMIFSNLTNVLTLSLQLAADFFFMLLMLFFLLNEGNTFASALYDALPFPKDIEKDIADRLNEVIKVLIAGNLLIMTLQGFAVGLGFYIAGLETPLLWGSIAAIFSLIPVIGTSIIWLPPVVFLMMSGQFQAGIFLGIWCLFWYLALENLLKPKVFGQRLKFHPIIFFFLLLGSLRSFNLPGIIIGPILLTLFYSFWEIYKLLGEYDSRNEPKAPENPA